MAEKLAPEKRHSFIHNGLSLSLYLFLINLQWFGQLKPCFEFSFFRFWFCLFRWEGVRMGPDFGGSEHVHKSSTKRSFQAILLQDSVQAPRTRHQRKPSLPQCLFLNFKIFFFLFLFWLLCMVLWVLWISLMSLNYWFWFSSQHELASPVKTDSSFWTLGNLFILFFFLCFFLMPLRLLFVHNCLFGSREKLGEVKRTYIEFLAPFCLCWKS